jgi:hypothetical protein
MKQMRLMFGRTKFQLVLALAALALATAAVVTSGASFTAHTANAANVFSTGTLAMSNTPSGMSTTISEMVPGDYHTGTVTIKNTGDVAGRIYLEPVAITGDTKGLAAQLDLVIMDGATQVYSGSLAGLAQHDLGSWAAGAERTYSFTVTLPDQGRDVSGVGLDNAFMGATTTAAFNWTAVSTPTGSR